MSWLSELQNFDAGMDSARGDCQCGACRSEGRFEPGPDCFWYRAPAAAAVSALPPVSLGRRVVPRVRGER
jgi:hypothetical protein